MPVDFRLLSRVSMFNVSCIFREDGEPVERVNLCNASPAVIESVA
jgi:hypothetical protein